MCISHTKPMGTMLWLVLTWCSAPTSFILAFLRCNQGIMEEQAVLHHGVAAHTTTFDPLPLVASLVLVFSFFL